MMSRLAKAMAKEFILQSLFKLGYRNKEDISNNPPYVLSVGSQNVRTNAAEQVTIRNGIVLDGAAGSQNTYGIDSSYDFLGPSGISNLRKWGSNLQVRIANSVTGAVSWATIMSSLIATNVCNFTSFWETSNTKNVCLFVNGDTNVYRWSGGVATFASATSTTITIEGTTPIVDLNFDQTGKLVIDGVTYIYTGAGLSTSQPYSQTPVNATVAIDNTHYISQQFITNANAVEITTVTLKLNITNSDNTLIGPPNIQAYLFDNNAGVPGALITSAASAPSGTTTGDYTVTFTCNWGVTANTTYHIAFATQWPVTANGSYVFSTYIGVAGGVGTNTGIAPGNGFAGLPASWSGVNGYLNMTINENDVSGLTFSGVLPDPTSVTINVGDVIVQGPEIATSTVVSAPLPTFDLIEVLRNQVYYGSLSRLNVYITKVNSFSDASSSVPRVVGEGASIVLDSYPVAFKPLENVMYISAGRDFWYQTQFTLSADLAKESLEVNRLKTAPNQGAQAQGLVGTFKNSLLYMSFEQIFNSLGVVKNILQEPQVVNMSDPIKYDIDNYTFGNNAHVHYDDYYIYLSVPNQSVVRIFNVNKKYWEAPQVLAISRFYHVTAVTPGAQIYGHSSVTDESYQLFVPGVFNDNGQPINAVAAFPYVSTEGGEPHQKKFFNKFYTEGYISSNTTLTLTVNYDFGGFSGNYSDSILGSDTKIIFNKITDGSIGKNTLGTQPVGTILNLPQPSPTPKFRKISTFTPVNNFEYQVVFSSNDVDQNWAILRFGAAIGASRDMATEISE